MESKETLIALAKIIGETSKHKLTNYYSLTNEEAVLCQDFYSRINKKFNIEIEEFFANRDANLGADE